MSITKFQLKRVCEKYQIDMLNVGSADCFIIQYFDNYGDSRLILVDAGNYSDGETILKFLNDHYKGLTIDFAIVSHPDKDHFGGFVYLLELLKEKSDTGIKIEKFIINDPGKHIDPSKLEGNPSKSDTEKEVRSVYDIENHGNLIELVDEAGISREEWLVTDTLDNIKESFFYLLGPSKEYFEELAPNLRHELEPIKESSTFSDTSRRRNIDEEKDDDSAHNASSIIFLFIPSGIRGNKYLFAGDATRESFDRIKGPKYIENCHWLKVPHHGSIHNLTTKLIDIITPNTAYISAAGNEHHPAAEIIEELKKHGTKVFATNINGSMLHRHGTENRDGWSPAKPL